MFDLDKLYELREKMVICKNLHEINVFFMDYFGENPEFIAIGAPPKDTEFMETLIAEAVSKIFNTNKIVLSHRAFVHIEEYEFIHGCFFGNGKPMSILYFEDLKLGVLCVLESFFGSGEIKYSRFMAATQEEIIKRLKEAGRSEK